jgi:hypothetical protein
MEEVIITIAVLFIGAIIGIVVVVALLHFLQIKRYVQSVGNPPN